MKKWIQINQTALIFLAGLFFLNAFAFSYGLRNGLLTLGLSFIVLGIYSFFN